MPYIDGSIVETPIEVLCEVIFVLTKVYRLSREEIVDSLLDFYDNTNCVLPHRETVLTGIKYFGKRNLDFVDCLLAAYFEVENITIHTFDGRLQKLIDTIINSG